MRLCRRGPNGSSMREEVSRLADHRLVTRAEIVVGDDRTHRLIGRVLVRQPEQDDLLGIGVFGDAAFACEQPLRRLVALALELLVDCRRRERLEEANQRDVRRPRAGCRAVPGAARSCADCVGDRAR